MSVTEIKKIFKEKSKEELIGLLVECYKNNPLIKEYITAKFGSKDNLNSIFEEYKKKVYDVFFPKSMRSEFKISEAKKAVREFKKLCNDKKLIIELMLYYVEMGVEFTNTYGDIDEAFYNSVASMFCSVVVAINDQEDSRIYDDLKDRLRAVVDDTDDIGWGLHEEVYNIYSQLELLDFE